MQVGDQILEVNNQSFITISHDKAVDILKTGHQLLMKVRDVGRLPLARTFVDETKWIRGQAITETDGTTCTNSLPRPRTNSTRWVDGTEWKKKEALSVHLLYNQS